jgi:peptidoglycan/LPS O-acetylase OafA/YrhL
MSLTIAERLQNRANNFDLLRFLAAGLVIFSHSFALSGNREPMLGTATLGTVGVAIFFIMSGFLIAQSWHQHPRVAAFLGKRLLRIMPGFIGVILFTVFVVGLAFTTIPTKAYLLSQDTSSYVNGVFLYTIQATLPGVFNANPLPNAVNGALWTLPYEFTAYLLVALLGVVSMFRSRRRILGLFLLMLPLNYVVKHWLVGAHLPFYNLDVEALVRLSTYFIGGVTLFTLREKIRLSKTLVLPALALFIMSCFWVKGWLYVSFLVLPYLILYLAFTKQDRLTRFGKHGDFSYGLYIYAFPVQQMIVASFHGVISPALLFGLSLPVTLVLAICSWHLIEAPCLRLKRYFNHERYPVKPTATSTPKSAPVTGAETEKQVVPLTAKELVS